ncbi:MAG: DUF4230 domain-containing protein [Polyangiaceae bacterium]|jgi:hypothetical protein|nr:DUF4230 domain-containing protein [Polyangiaceae bacterium]
MQQVAFAPPATHPEPWLPIMARTTPLRRILVQDKLPPRPTPLTSPIILVLAVAAAVVLGAAASFAVSSRAGSWRPPPLHSSVTVVKPSASVVVAVRDLARLETTTYHIERVVDLRDKQSKFFGLLEFEDAILLVAAADVTAGVDLGKLREQDVQADPASGRVQIELPSPEVFHAKLDGERTFVHSRKTGVLARREEQLESRARLEAERTVKQAALDAGILNRACGSARTAVGALARSMGYREVDVRCAPP